MAPPLTRILYVEDDPDIQTVARMSLETVGGFTVEVASSGAEAIEIAPRFEPELIILDVMMPEMDGPATMQALRGIAGFEQTPIVFMTAKVMESEVARYMELGASSVIPKPFDPMTLPVQITEIWQKHNG